MCRIFRRDGRVQFSGDILSKYFFPVLFWVPSSDLEIVSGHSSLLPRKWEVSLFDLYTLAADKHQLRVPVELMNVFLSQTNAEVVIEADNAEAAFAEADALRAMLYLRGLAPTIAPSACNHSLNDYAGINSRGSASLRDRLPEGLKDGINSKTSRVESWPKELSLACHRGCASTLATGLAETDFVAAAEDALRWQKIEQSHPPTRRLRAAFVEAPLLPSRSSSILHIWQAIEHLFNVQGEVSYRTALLLAELCSPSTQRKLTYEAARSSYSVRSKIAHGYGKEANERDWMQAWNLLRKVAEAILRRKGLPTEAVLLGEILNR